MNGMFVGSIMLLPVVYIVLGLFGFSDDPVYGVQSVMGVTKGVAELMVYMALASFTVVGLFLIISSYRKQRQEYIRSMSIELDKYSRRS